MKKRLVVGLASAALVFSSATTPAHADAPIFSETSVADKKQPAEIDYHYNLISTGVVVMQSSPVTLVLKANFSTSLNSKTFMAQATSKPLLRVKVLNELGDHRGELGYFWIEPPTNVPYQGSTPIQAIASVYADPKIGANSGRRDISVKCNAKTWMETVDSSDWVAFSIDRNCADLKDIIYVTSFIDSNIYNGSTPDNKYAPVNPIMIDMTKVPRPPKMKDQIVSFTSRPSSVQSLDNPTASATVYSTENAPLVVNSLNPSICTAALSGNSVSINFLAAGGCSLEAYSPGNSTVNPSERVVIYMTVNPKVQVNQYLSYDEPDWVTDGDPDFPIRAYTTSNLPITIESMSPDVCRFYDSKTNPFVVTIVGPGTCEFKLMQAGSDKYFPATGYGYFDVDAKPLPEETPKPPKAPKTPSTPKTTSTQRSVSASNGKSTTNKTDGVSGSGKNIANTKKTIRCVKRGFPDKKITAVNPKCPSGYTKKS